jgi:hypothetical protein
MHSASFPKGIGSKFFPDGQVRAYPGNTVLCHVAGIPPLIERLDKLYHWLLDAGEAQIYTLLPPSSWHMTVFDGVCDGNRNGERWPGDLARNAPLPEINQTFEARLKAGRFGPGLSFAMRVRRLRPLMNVIAIELEPADKGEERAIRALRQRIAATLSFDCSAPDTYTFHITLAYFLRFPDASEKARLESLMTAEIQDMAKSLDPFRVGPPEFCRFNDMFAFSRRLHLR